MDDILDIADVAEALKVSERTVKREIYDNKLPSIRVRGRVLIRRTDLEAYINNLAAHA